MSCRRRRGAALFRVGVPVIFLVILLVIFPMSACHHQSDPASGDAAGGAVPASATRGDTTAHGTVHVLGAAPAIVVLQSGAARVGLEGLLARELATLEGAIVEVHGAVGTAPPLGGPPRAIAVQRYEITEIAGRRPVVGLLGVDAAGVARVDTVRLARPPAELLRRVGDKVWVVGTRAPSGDVTVEVFGVLATTRPRP